MNLTTRRARKPDNTGGYDVAILDERGRVVAECFEHVGELPDGTLDRRDAAALARRFAASERLLAACRALLPYVEDQVSRGRVHDSDTSHYGDERAIAEARAAIADATGGAA